MVGVTVDNLDAALPTSAPGKATRGVPVCRVMGALVAALLLLLAGCGGDDEDSALAAGENEVTTLTVGVLPIGNAAPLYLGMEKGFFREERLELKAQVAQGGNERATT